MPDDIDLGQLERSLDEMGRGLRHQVRRPPPEPYIDAVAAQRRGGAWHRPALAAAAVVLLTVTLFLAFRASNVGRDGLRDLPAVALGDSRHSLAAISMANRLGGDLQLPVSPDMSRRKGGTMPAVPKTVWDLRRGE